MGRHTAAGHASAKRRWFFRRPRAGAGAALLLAGLTLVALGACGGPATPGRTPPAAPASVTATAVAGAIEVAWVDRSDDEDVFVVTREAVGRGGSTTTELPADSRRYRDESVVPGNEYRYGVAAVSAAGSSGITWQQGTVRAVGDLRRLRVERTGSGEGRVTSDPEGIDCPQVCEADFPAGATVRLVAAPEADGALLRWSGACAGADACEVVLDEDREVEAEFTVHALTVTVTGGTGHAVRVTPPGADCSDRCVFGYPSVVSVGLVKPTGADVTAWGGACSGTDPDDPICFVTVDGPTSATVELREARVVTPPSVATLSVAVGGDGRVTSAPPGIDCVDACSFAFPVGSEVTLTAEPAPGSELRAWSDACTGAGACRVAMDGDRTVGATFAPLPRHTVTVARGGTGAGVVRSGGEDVTSVTVDAGGTVALDAVPAAGSAFTAWTGACAGAGPSCVLPDVREDLATTAVFDLEPHELVLEFAGEGAGSVTVDGVAYVADAVLAVPSGTDLVLTAAPEPGSVLSGWDGACREATGTVCTLAGVSGDLWVEVAFALEPGPPPPAPFEIVLRFPEGTSSSLEGAARAAAARWEALIAADLPDQVVVKARNACGRDEPELIATVDDVVIDVFAAPRDGTGGILASAGPCLLRAGGLPAYGTIRVDASDLADLEASGLLLPVLLHEMGHVLGLGTLWDAPFGLLGYDAAPPCHGATHTAIAYRGAAANAVYAGLGGSGDAPVETVGGAGTACVHWEEGLFGTELMTGWLDPGAPLSALSVAALDDLGYRSDPAAADPYALPTCPPDCALVPSGDAEDWEEPLPPTAVLGPDGNPVAPAGP